MCEDNVNYALGGLYLMDDKELSSEKMADRIATEHAEIDAIIDNMTLFDDNLMSLVFDKNIPATELLLRIILERNIKVVWVRGQVKEKNSNPKGRNITLDIKAIDIDGSYINIEVQGNASGAHVKRARYHSSVLDEGMLKKRQDFKQIKDSYVIFIYKNDKFKKGYPLYHVERIVIETGEMFDDGSHIIYVNGKYKGDDDIGKLMRDFRCKTASKMQFEELANGVRHFKETEEGRDTMCESVEKYGDRREERGEKRGEENTRIESVKNLMDNMKWTVEQALDALSIKGKERTVIISKLQK